MERLLTVLFLSLFTYRESVKRNVDWFIGAFGSQIMVHPPLGKEVMRTDLRPLIMCKYWSRIFWARKEVDNPFFRFGTTIVQSRATILNRLAYLRSKKGDFPMSTSKKKVGVILSLIVMLSVAVVGSRPRCRPPRDHDRG